MRTRVTRITSKGQVVIPKEFRDLKDLHIGDSVLLASQEHDIRIDRRAGWARETAGCLAAPVPQMEPSMLDEMVDCDAIQDALEEYGDVS